MSKIKKEDLFKGNIEDFNKVMENCKKIEVLVNEIKELGVNVSVTMDKDDIDKFISNTGK